MPRCSKHWLNISAHRSYTPRPQTSSWQAPPEAAALERPRFFLHDSDGCDFRSSRTALKRLLSGRSMQDILPVSKSQYVPDSNIIDALTTHPLRTNSPLEVDWHIIGATPATSALLGELGQLGGLTGHGARMHALATCLHEHRLAFPWANLFILIPALSLESTVGHRVMSELLRRNVQAGMMDDVRWPVGQYYDCSRVPDSTIMFRVSFAYCLLRALAARQRRARCLRSLFIVEPANQQQI